jgi:hypothetical protein
LSQVDVVAQVCAVQPCGHVAPSPCGAETVWLPLALADSDWQLAVSLPLTFMRARARPGEVGNARQTTFRCATDWAIAPAAGVTELASDDPGQAEAARGAPNGPSESKRKRADSEGPEAGPIGTDSG